MRLETDKLCPLTISLHWNSKVSISTLRTRSTSDASRCRWLSTSARLLGGLHHTVLAYAGRQTFACSGIGSKWPDLARMSCFSMLWHIVYISAFHDPLVSASSLLLPSWLSTGRSSISLSLALYVVLLLHLFYPLKCLL